MPSVPEPFCATMALKMSCSETFSPENLSRDEFLGGRLVLSQPKQGYRAATDPVLLAAFVRARTGELVLDLGCGAGTAGLCLARRVNGIELHGLELQPAYADLARHNARQNEIPFEVHTGDLLTPPDALKQMVFDHVIANPPYRASGAGTASPRAGKDFANRETGASLEAWLDFALRRLRPRGCLTLIHRTERLQDILCALQGRTGAIEILPLSARTGRSPGRILLRARKAVQSPLILYAPLTLHKGSSHVRDENDYTDEVTKVLYELSELLPDSPLSGIQG